MTDDATAATTPTPTDSRRDALPAIAAGAATFGGLQALSRFVRARRDGYNVAEVGVEGRITREGRRPGQRGAAADEITDQIERADDDDHVRALLLRLNTPGGAVLPSEDIRLAAERFEGPTVAYATDTCASGGYWIASGCDELWAREASVVGSIGVIASQVNATDLADRIGLQYEPFIAGEFKDAGNPLTDLEDGDREYFQGIVDGYYEHFVERVAAGRGLEEETIRETEAKVYLGADAEERGLVDELGPKDEVIERIESELDTEATVEEFTPDRGLMERLQGGVEAAAFAVGAGVASEFAGIEDGFDFRL